MSPLPAMSHVSDGGGGQAPALACLTSILHGPQLQPPLPVPLLPGVLNSFPMTVYPAAPQLVIPSVWPGPMFVGQGALDAVSGHPAMLSTQISPVPHSSVLDDAAVSGLKLLASSQDPARACHPAKRNDRGSESDTSDSHGEQAGTGGGVNTIFPRRKQGQHARINSQPVVLDEATLSQLFTLPLHKAAVKLGISATAMKSACRKLGIKKWPYRALGVAAKAQHSSCSSASSTCLPQHAADCASTSPSRPHTTGVENCGSNDSSLDGSGDLSRDAMLLAETMRLLQQSAHASRQDAVNDPPPQNGGCNISASSSECDSEISGASTRDDPGSAKSRKDFDDESEDISAISAHIKSPKSSVASLLN